MGQEAVVFGVFFVVDGMFYGRKVEPWFAKKPLSPLWLAVLFSSGSLYQRVWKPSLASKIIPPFYELPPNKHEVLIFCSRQKRWLSFQRLKQIKIFMSQSAEVLAIQSTQLWQMCCLLSVPASLKCHRASCVLTLPALLPGVTAAQRRVHLTLAWCWQEPSAQGAVPLVLRSRLLLSPPAEVEGAQRWANG